MRSTDRRRLGSTGVQLTQMGVGGAGLGSMRTLISDEVACSVLRSAWDAGIRCYDTAPWYGRGLSERRVGGFLKDLPRRDFVLSTKVGRRLRQADDPDAFDPAPWVGGLPFEVVFDYTYDGIMRSYEDSQQRLGIPSIDILLIHDLDSWYHTSDQIETYWGQLRTGGWRALDELRRSGAVKAIGSGINLPGLIPRFLECFDPDVFLVAMPYTLLDQPALSTDLPLCESRGVGVLIGAVFSSGILATGLQADAQYNYSDASEAILNRVRRLQGLCERHGISLAAAALQFPLGHPSVACVLPGAFRAEQVQQNVHAFEEDIPSAFWQDLKLEGLLPEQAPVPA